MHYIDSQLSCVMVMYVICVFIAKKPHLRTKNLFQPNVVHFHVSQNLEQKQSLS